MAPNVERRDLSPDLSISRVLTGLWQLADMERDGRRLDLDRAAAARDDTRRGCARRTDQDARYFRKSRMLYHAHLPAHGIACNTASSTFMSTR